MPNGIDWTQEELNRYLGPLEAIDPVLRNFAKRSGTRMVTSTYHGYLSREISFVSQSRTGAYKLIKSIYLTLQEKTRPPKYVLEVIVSTSYGVKELFRFVPLLGRLCDSWKRVRWQHRVHEFQERIDPVQLEPLLEEAKRILDLFDEKEKTASGCRSPLGHEPS